VPATNLTKKRKVALFLAYVGHGYQGMQRNPGAKSIEDELFKALHAAGAIADCNADEDGYVKARLLSQNSLFVSAL
jgi:tRNA pseudouridine38-40 synthase